MPYHGSSLLEVCVGDAEVLDELYLAKIKSNAVAVQSPRLETCTPILLAKLSRREKRSRANSKTSKRTGVILPNSVSFCEKGEVEGKRGTVWPFPCSGFVSWVSNSDNTEEKIGVE